MPDDKKEQKRQEKKDAKQLPVQIRKSEVRMWLDHYDDIFSDFDPRPYSERALSDDFLKEAKKVTRDTESGSLELNFLIPQNHQKKDQETLIQKRLHEHFKKHAQMLAAEIAGQVQRGATMVSIGIAIMLIAASIAYVQKDAFVWSLVLVILEPAGWFLVWSGMDAIISGQKERGSEKEFNEKLSKAGINFNTY